MPVLSLQDSFDRFGNRDSMFDPVKKQFCNTLWKVKSVARHKSSTAAEEVSSHCDSSYHHRLQTLAKRIGLSQCNNLPTLISFPHRFYICATQPISPVLMGKKHQVEVTTGSRSFGPAHR